MSGRALLLALALLPGPAAPSTAAAATASQPPASRPLEFGDAAEEARFHALASELRCVQCHNQSLADSDALIARDMRAQVLALIRQGRSDGQIRDFLVERYGPFVLYRPALDASTWLLWAGPGLLLLGGGWALWRTVRRRARLLDAAPARADSTPSPADGNDPW